MIMYIFSAIEECEVDVEHVGHDMAAHLVVCIFENESEVMIVDDRVDERSNHACECENIYLNVTSTYMYLLLLF